MKHVNILHVKQGTGELVEIYLENGLTGGRLLCSQSLIPLPGQYLMAGDPDSDAPLPVSIFNASSISGGFMIAPSIPRSWQPGTALSLRGPLGKGFSLPGFAHCVALVALGKTSARLRPLLVNALEQDTSVVLVSDSEFANLPPEVEIQPVSVLAEVAQWADYIAIDIPRESLSGLPKKLGLARPGLWQAGEVQVLVHMPMPCGGMGECGVCAAAIRRGWKMACKDGPVFDLNDLI